MLELKWWQEESRDFLVTNKTAICADEMGLGKTRTALSALEVADPTRILIISGKSAQLAWVDETLKWTDYASPIVIAGTAQKRRSFWRKAYKPENGFAIITFASLQRDLNFLAANRMLDWDCVIIDEAHKLSNRKTQNFKTVKQFTLHNPKYFWLLTGSPARRGPQSLWAYLNLIERKTFSSYWKFVNTFCVVIDGFFGKEIVDVRNKEELHLLLSAYMIRHKKTETGMQEKIRGSKLLEMEPKQAKIYNSMKQEMLLEINEEDVILAASVLAKITRLRQILVTPKLLIPDAPIGAAAEYISDKLEEQDNPCITVFSIYKAAFVHYREYFEGKGYKVHELVGGLDLDEVRKRIEAFRTEGGVMLCSTKFAESFSMEFCTYGIVVGADYDPEVNKQAEDRIHRMTSTGIVNIEYLVHKDTEDERVIDILLEKGTMIGHTLNTVKELAKIYGIKKDVVQ